MPEEIYYTKGNAKNGTFESRWNFSFDSYVDHENERFGTLCVFNDETLSPGAARPLHPHKDNELVTYIARGEFRHLDGKGHNGTLKQGWVQHTTVGKGMWHSEINNLDDKPLRFVQMWFRPSRKGVTPHYEQKPVQRLQRVNKLLPLVSNEHLGALKINADAEVFSSFLKKGKLLRYPVSDGRGVFVYVLEGALKLNGKKMQALSSAQVFDEPSASLTAARDTEFLLVDVRL